MNYVSTTLLTVFLYLFPFFSEAQFPEVKLTPMYNEDYLELRDPSLLDRSFKIPNVKIYADASLSGSPEIELTKEGLKIKSKLVCEWYDRSGDSSAVIKFKELKSDDPCKQDIFPFVISDEGKFEVLRFWIIANGKETDLYYSTKNKGSEFFIDKKTVSNFSLKKSLKSISEAKYKDNYSALKAFSERDPNMNNFINQMNICLDKKDISCLNLSEDKWEKISLAWGRYFCINHNLRNEDRYKNYCDDVKKYICKKDGQPAYEFAECQKYFDLISKGDPNTKVKYSDLNQKKEVENILWKEIKTCFEIKENFSRLKLSGSMEPYTQYDENYLAACSIGKTLSAPFWALQRIDFRVDKYGGQIGPIKFPKK